ncbi:hypothetical protein VTN00DRAFT_5817 [Thermoascus crustaceus]|uniref:uncharacterized protein n=1 Tax=Thermoascus crustaceus TaxID=5088 RepID=UPI0037427A60
MDGPAPAPDASRMPSSSSLDRRTCQARPSSPPPRLAILDRSFAGLVHLHVVIFFLPPLSLSLSSLSLTSVVLLSSPPCHDSCYASSEPIPRPLVSPRPSSTVISLAIDSVAVDPPVP